MVWQKGKLRFLEFFHLFLPSLVNFVVPAALMHFSVPKGVPDPTKLDRRMKPGGAIVILLFAATIATAVSFKAFLSLPPALGMMLGLGYLQMYSYLLQYIERRRNDKGLAFDSIRGDFTLKSGNAYTENLLLKGPAAEIGVVGRTGLGERDYDQTAVVTGSLGQSLPVAGALAGGPVVGAALLVFSQIFKEPLKGITRGYYRITGSWDNPVVQRVEDSDKKKAEKKESKKAKE